MNAPKASDKLLICRKTVDAMLHLSRRMSYALFPPSAFKGMVPMAAVRRAVERSARNGAKWGGGEFVALTHDSLGVSARTLFRSLKTAPHFRITRKVALVEADRIEDFLGRKRLTRQSW